KKSQLFTAATDVAAVRDSHASARYSDAAICAWGIRALLMDACCPRTRCRRCSTLPETAADAAAIEGQCHLLHVATEAAPRAPTRRIPAATATLRRCSHPRPLRLALRCHSLFAEPPRMSSTCCPRQRCCALAAIAIAGRLLPLSCDLVRAPSCALLNLESAIAVHDE
ncbi:hypothetical protein Dimus_037771, partial [Dionaea muscipula]